MKITEAKSKREGEEMNTNERAWKKMNQQTKQNDRTMEENERASKERKKLRDNERT